MTSSFEFAVTWWVWPSGINKGEICLLKYYERRQSTVALYLRGGFAAIYNHLLYDRFAAFPTFKGLTLTDRNGSQNVKAPHQIRFEIVAQYPRASARDFVRRGWRF